MPEMGLKQAKMTKNCYFLRTRRHKTLHNFLMGGSEGVGSDVKIDRIDLSFPLSI